MWVALVHGGPRRFSAMVALRTTNGSLLLAQMWVSVSVPKSSVAVPWVEDILMGGSNYIAHPPAIRVDDSGPQNLKNPRSHFVVVRYCRFGWVPGSAGLGDFPVFVCSACCHMPDTAKKQAAKAARCGKCKNCLNPKDQPQEQQAAAAPFSSPMTRRRQSDAGRSSGVAVSSCDVSGLQWTVGGYAHGASEHPNPETL